MPDHKLDEEIKIAPAEANDSIKIVAESDQSISNAENPAEESQEKNIVLQNFELGEEIGSGTLGIVYHSSNIETKSKFALKEVSHEYCRNAGEIKAVLCSLKAATELANPHLCAYYTSGLHGGKVYAVSDELAGQTLADAIASGRVFNTDRFIELFRQLCDALKSLHQRNIIHGNLKPSNIFLIDTGTGHDFVKITDFGIAGAFGEEQRHEFLRKSGGSYLSPEQCLGYELDQRSDIYSLGLIMYQVVTGKPFIEGQTPVHTVLKQLNLNCKKGLKEAGIPDSIQHIISKCLEKNRSQRYFSVADLDMDLELASAARTDLTAFATEWSDEQKNKKKALTHEDNIKVVLSSVIGMGVLACLLMAGLNYFSYHLQQSLQSSFTIPATGMQRLPPQVASSNSADMKSDDLTREAEKIISNTSRMSPSISSGDAFYSATDPKPNSVQEQNLEIAETMYRQAITAFENENFDKTDPAYKAKLAGLWTSLGELNTRARLTADGNGIFDRKNAVTPTLGTNSLNSYVLYPAYPGLYPNPNLNVNDLSAEANFEKAASLFDNKFDEKNVALLWDLNYTKFQLGKLDEAISYQKKLIEVYNSKKDADMANLILSHDNLGRFYMWKSQYKDAIEQFKIAKNLDKATYKVPNTSEWTNQVRADLAYGLFMDGRLSEAERMARKNLAMLNPVLTESQDTDCQRLNMNILYKVLKLQHRDNEATAVELDAYKKNLAPW